MGLSLMIFLDLQKCRQTLLRVQTELRALQLRYDKLEERKKQISRNYKKDWDSWRIFKQWVADNKENVAAMSATVQGITDELQFEAGVEGIDTPKGATAYRLLGNNSSPPFTPSPAVRPDRQHSPQTPLALTQILKSQKPLTPEALIQPQTQSQTQPSQVDDIYVPCSPIKRTR